MLNIKPPQPENIEKIIQIDNESGGSWEKSDFYDFVNCNNEVKNRIYLAENNDKIVGFVTAEFPIELDNPIIIRKISVDRAVRLNGYGRKLFSHIYDMAILRKYTHIEIIINEDNNNGLKFIKKIAHIEKSECKNGKYHIVINIS